MIALLSINVTAIEANATTNTELSLDSIAWENLTYYDIFIENNLAYVDGFNKNNWGSFSQYAGTNIITDDIYVTAPYSLKAFGSPSQQIVSSVSNKSGEYFVASKVYCTRYTKGELGVCLGNITVGITGLTDSFVTSSAIVTMTRNHKIYIGSIHSADLDGYVDDPVVINMNIFTTQPSAEEMTTLYEQYVQIEKVRDRAEVFYTDAEMYNAFMVYLQKKSEDIGMSSSTFCDPVGNYCNYASARDIAKLLIYADKYAQLEEIWSLASKDVNVNGINARTQKVISTVHKQELEEYYHILGGKTGTLGDKRNLAVILEIPNSEDKLIVVALYANGANDSDENRYQAVKEIAEIAICKYNDPTFDSSASDVCCASAIACVLSTNKETKILYEKDADAQQNLASITKVLTAICALDIYKDLGAQITYKQFDIDTCPWYAKDFYVGDTMSLEDTLFALLLPSSNVTAVTIARSAGKILLSTPEVHTHSYTSIITLPTCTDGGYTTYVCECGESYTGDHVEAVGHSFGEWFVVDNSTCINEGQEQRNCASCDHYETEIIPATGHSYASEVTLPTCTVGGYTTYVCECGDSYTGDHIEAVGHIFGEWQNDEESHWRECTVCKAQESDKENHTDSDNNGLCDLCSKQMALISDDTGEADENPSAKESIIVMFFELLIELIKDIFKAIFGA